MIGFTRHLSGPYIDADPRAPVRELDHRRNADHEVQLLWNPNTNGVSILVAEEESGEVLRFKVEPEYALMAFHDPFAYLWGDRKRT